MAENNEKLEEFSSIVVPVFTDLGSEYIENQDSSISSPAETDAPLQSVVQAVDSRSVKNQSPISPNKRPIMDSREDAMDDKTMVVVTVANWLRFDNLTSNPRQIFKIKMTMPCGMTGQQL